MALCVRNYPALLQIWPNLPDCVVGCFLCVNAKHRRKATCGFGKWFAFKARKLPLKVYDTRNTSVYHTLRLEFCTECMLSLNMGLAGLSKITRMSEIRRLYPSPCQTRRTVGSVIHHVIASWKPLRPSPCKFIKWFVDNDAPHSN